MFAYLSQHPQLYLPLRKEVHFFGSDLTRKPGNPWFITDEDRYLSLFRDAGANQVVGEASVLYLYSSRAAAEIKAFRPDAKIIIQLRNPVDMLYSYHGQHLLAVQEDIADFEEAYRRVERRRQLLDMPRWCIMPQQLLYPDIARYSEQVERYFEQFGPENVHVMIYDDFRNDSRGEFAKLLTFLGVDPDFEPRFDPVNSHRQVRWAWLQGQTQLPSWPTRAVLSLLPDRYAYLSLIHLAMLNSKPAQRPPLRPEFRRELEETFRPDVTRLGSLLGRDFSHWVGGCSEP